MIEKIYSYSDALKKAMAFLGEKQDTIFVGQAVSFPGTAMFETLQNVPDYKKIEFPVFEESQIGISCGMSLNGFTVVSIIPRLNFLLLAMNQLVHLSKIKKYSYGDFCPKVIIRSAIGSEEPLWPSYLHIGDYTEGFKSILQELNIVRLDRAEDILPAYQQAYYLNTSSILIEWGDKLN